ncbi:NAD-dependent epimerase/dehydratase family protein [Sphingopyxis sp. LC81]|uniref:NAD-dependent epimerase/dehydratase family protein n=1 Tax=Sphingopyxis sp. LC81 TaxID=1502850 RepID=UPI00055FDF3A|nr:NAD-dependent epimerase/dehydratase family protein [Sphingopyxis sp. LC81]
MSAHRRILITGAGGFIGRRLAKVLAETGADFRTWTRADGDLRDAGAVQSALGQMQPTLIYHLASQMPSADSEGWSRIADEQRMLSNLAYSMPGHGQLIYSGSMAEYGKSGILSEETPCTPDTGYGCAKFSGTNLCLALRAQCSLDIRVARLFGVYGPGEAPGRLLPALIERLRNAQPVPLSDGAQLRDFIHVDDVCTALSAFAAAPEKQSPAISNIGTGAGVTVREVCERVANILGAAPDLLQFGALPRRAVDQDCLVADVQRMQQFTAPPAQRWLDNDLSQQIVRSMIAYHRA